MTNTTMVPMHPPPNLCAPYPAIKPRNMLFITVFFDVLCISFFNSIDSNNNQLAGLLREEIDNCYGIIPNDSRPVRTKGKICQ